MPPVSDTPSSDAAWAAAAPDLPPFPRPRPPVPPPPPVEYVGYVVRATALAMDLAILGLCGVPLLLAITAGVHAGFVFLDVPAPVTTEAALSSLVSAAWGVMALAYFTLLHRGHGQTIGKAAVGIRVRSRNLEAIGTARSLLRAFSYFLSSTLFGAGFLLAALTPRHRAWHDYVAGTCVVRMTPEEA